MSDHCLDSELGAIARNGAASTDSGENRLIAALPVVHRQRFSSHIDHVQLTAGQILAQPDEPIRFVYFPQGALASLLVTMQDGSAIEGAAIGNQGTTGMPIFLADGIATEEITVQIPGAAARISANIFRTLVGESAPLRASLQRYALALMNHLARTAGCNRLHSVRQRCARWLLTASDLVNAQGYPLTHEALANLLGVRRASVTEAAETLKQDGLIDYHRGWINILDADALEGAACEDYKLIKTGYDHIR